MSWQSPALAIWFETSFPPAAGVSSVATAPRSPKRKRGIIVAIVLAALILSSVAVAIVAFRAHGSDDGRANAETRVSIPSLEFIDPASLPKGANAVAGTTLAPGTYTVFMTGEHIQSVQWVQNANSTEEVDLRLKLDAEGTRKFEQLTSQNLNKPIPLAIGGKIIVAPVVGGTVVDGIVVISGPTDLRKTLGPALVSGRTGSSSPVVVEPEPSSPAPWSAAELKSASLTKKFETPSKYTCTVKVTVWKPIPKVVDSPVTHPAYDEAVITPGSDYDPSTDTVIPFSMTVRNTTKGFDLKKPGIRYRLTTPTRGVTRSATETRTLEAMTWSTDGPQVTSCDLRGASVSLENGNEDTWPSVSWSDPLAPDASVTQYGYFIYRDHRTPAEPHGTKWVLGFIVVMPTYTGGSAVGPMETKGLSLTGKVEETGLVF
jgi:hypothetical protein